MVNGYSLDPHPRANFAKEQFAVARIPRIKRDRVPATSVVKPYAHDNWLVTHTSALPHLHR
jgi:hypothetical protein